MNWHDKLHKLLDGRWKREWCYEWFTKEGGQQCRCVKGQLCSKCQRKKDKRR